ncbi:MAG: hypothetical protein ACI4M3_09530 [Acutalibacteraceae bacterium]
MHRKRAVIGMICSFLMLVPIFSVTAHAETESHVIYEGEAKRFVFVPQSTDLFQNFKNVYPGDELSQTIVIDNNGTKNIRVYLRAEPVLPSDYALLDNMTLSIWKEGGVLTSAASVAKGGGLQDAVFLGNFSVGEQSTLEVHLNVTEEMNNTYQNQSGIVQWVFSVVEEEEEPPVETGDTTFGVTVALGTATISLTAFLLMMKKRHACLPS